MARRYYTCRVIGSGTEEDPYRAEVADDGVGYASEIPCDANGVPLDAECVAWVEDKDDATVTRRATVKRAATLEEARIAVRAKRGGIRQR